MFVRHTSAPAQRYTNNLFSQQNKDVYHDATAEKPFHYAKLLGKNVQNFSVGKIENN